MKKIWISSMVVLACASTAAAQGGAGLSRTPDPAGIAAEKAVAAEREQKAVGEIRAKMAVEARITTGVPYSADAVTETTQVLADGNRINRKSITRVYRDAEGRTRREDVDENGNTFGVSIVDPVAHVSYVLDPTSRTAWRDGFVMAMPAMMRSRRPEPGVQAADEAAAKIEAEKKARRAAEASDLPSTSVRVRGRGAAPPPPPPAPPPGVRADMERVAAAGVTTEDLGRQSIEGVNAAGSRSTTTIAAGAIGNLQPIKVVSEQWFSPDLQVLVMTRHVDPRTGDTTYRLQNIVRAEPDRSLFTVPSDYTLRESGIRQPLMK